MNVMHRPLLTGAILGMALCSLPLTLAAESGSLKVEPELPADPAVAAILEKLGDNECAQLPPVKIHGEFNAIAKRFGLHERGPGSRDFSLKMPYAPDRQRAFYCGGNHGVPHKLNDIWEYDLASNTWVLLFAPTFNERGEYEDNAKLVYRDGIVMTENGSCISSSHTFSGITYDRESKLLLWYNRHTKMKPAGAPPAEPYAGPALWGFDPAKKEWVFLKTAPPYPDYDPGSGFDYLPDLNRSLWSNNRRSPDMWLYDHAAKRWEKLPVKGGLKDSARMSAQKVYDEKRQVLICHGGHSNYTCEFDLKTHTWTRTVEIDEDEKNAPKGADKLSTFAFDSANGVALFCDNMGGYVWVYDPGLAPRKWVRLEPKNSKPGARKEGGIRDGGKFTPMGFFHPVHNVLVLNNGSTTTWVYRYKRKSGGE